MRIIVFFWVGLTPLGLVCDEEMNRVSTSHHSLDFVNGATEALRDGYVYTILSEWATKVEQFSRIHTIFRSIWYHTIEFFAEGRCQYASSERFLLVSPYYQ